MRCIFFDKLFKISESKNTEHLTPTTIQTMVMNVKMFTKLTSILYKTGKGKARKDKKPSFPQQLVESWDFYKPVLKKIMTTHE